MTNRLGYRTHSRSNILYRNGDLVKDLNLFINSQNRQGYDIVVPQCISSNNTNISKLTQAFYRNFPDLASNIELFVSTNRNYGHTQFIEINNRTNKNLNKIFFANMLCMKNTRDKRKIDYIALAKCLSEISIFIKQRLSNTENDKIQIISSKLGTGFAGGNWLFIEQLINDSWDAFTTTIYHYDH